MKIERMKCWHLTNPVGFDMQRPVFSFTVDGEGEAVARVRVQVSLAPHAWETPQYDSGWQAQRSARAFEAPLALLPFTRYHWRVLVSGASGGRYTSQTAFFETARGSSPWEAQWITAAETGDTTPCFHRTLHMDEDIAWARLYVCGLGLYMPYIDGARISDEYLTPGCNNYDAWLQYQTYDVTSLLTEGKHELSVLMGDGWYKGRFSSRMRSALFGDQYALLAELRMRTTDGREWTLGTDTDWLVSASPVLANSIYDGEVWDARREAACFAQGGPMPKAVLRAPFTHGPLHPRLSPPVRVQQRLTAYTVLHTPAGETVLDFGQNMAGWVAFDSRLKSGERITLQYGEVLQDGCFYRENLRTAKAEYTYIASGDDATVHPHFTYYGFRYVKVIGRLSGLTNIHACVLHTDMERTGWIETANPKLDRLFENARWSQVSNAVDLPTDCPQRDERMGWTGDAQVFAQTATFNYDTAAFYRKYMVDMGYEQQRFGGSVPHMVPEVFRKDISAIDRDEENVHGSCAWGDAATVIPWTLYTQYGDRALLAEQYPGMKQWVDHIRRNDERYHCGRLWTTGFHYADWLALDNPDPTSRHGGTDPHFVASCYYYHSARLTGRAAQALGRPQEAMAYHRLAQEVRAAILRKWLPEGRLTVHTQTAAALLLKMRLVPRAWRAGVAKALRTLVRDNGERLTCGFVGTPCLLDALADNGYVDTAYALLLREAYPGWLYAVNLGATTIWERWNSLTPDGRISETGMNSLNHCAYGAVAGWMYRALGGLHPLSPGYARALIHPRPDRRVGAARTVFHSASGCFAVAWRYAQASLHYDIMVPDGAEALLLIDNTQPGQLSPLPPGTRQGALGLLIPLTGGRHRFSAAHRVAQEDGTCTDY